MSGLRAVCASLQDRLLGAPYLRRLLVASTNWILWKISYALDIRFDKEHGTDTSGFIPLDRLTIESAGIGEAIWYEPMSVKTFNQIMGRLKIDFARFDFLDFGSGKGRVLLLASEYGFRRIIGVEFARELHDLAARNTAVYERYHGKACTIETVHMDATRFPIPDVPMVIFFYSPFKGKVMEQVLGNISDSFRKNPREIILIFHGRNPQSIELFKATQFSWEELQLHPDWSRAQQYRTFVFTSPGGTEAAVRAKMQ